jgi:hypothetical protein
VRARAEDLRDGAFDQLAGAGLFELVADGDLAPGLEDAGDVAAGGMMVSATLSSWAPICASSKNIS